MSAPAGLSITELFAKPQCDWWRLSKAKRGPRLAWACRFCNSISKNKTCPMAGLATEASR